MSLKKLYYALELSLCLKQYHVTGTCFPSSSVRWERSSNSSKISKGGDVNATSGVVCLWKANHGLEQKKAYFHNITRAQSGCHLRIKEKESQQKKK